MSKRDIETVCCLAAHLAVKSQMLQGEGLVTFGPALYRAPRCAADAMALQRLGRSARNLVKRGTGGQRAMDWVQRIVNDGNTVLKPYGLGCCFDFDEAPHFFVVGLPGNGNDPSDGFGV